MARETTEAVAIRRGAEDQWKGHLVMCSACGRAKESRRPALRCRSGAALYAAWQSAGAVAKAERALDALPIPGQGELDLGLS